MSIVSVEFFRWESHNLLYCRIGKAPMDQTTVRLVAGILAVVLVAIIVLRRKKKGSAAEDDF